MRRRNPGAFLKFTFIVFSQVQCVLGSQVSVNSHVMLLSPAGCRFFSQDKLSPRRPDLGHRKKKQLPREDMWKRRVVNKHHRCSCCGQKHVCTYVVGGRVGMNETCYFTFDMKKLVSTTPPHPAPPFGLMYPQVCLAADLCVISTTPPHPTLWSYVSSSLSCC